MSRSLATAFGSHGHEITSNSEDPWGGRSGLCDRCKSGDADFGDPIFRTAQAGQRPCSDGVIQSPLSDTPELDSRTRGSDCRASKRRGYRPSFRGEACGWNHTPAAIGETQLSRAQKDGRWSDSSYFVAGAYLPASAPTATCSSASVAAIRFGRPTGRIRRVLFSSDSSFPIHLGSPRGLFRITCRISIAASSTS